MNQSLHEYDLMTKDSDKALQEGEKLLPSHSQSQKVSEKGHKIKYCPAPYNIKKKCHPLPQLKGNIKKMI